MLELETALENWRSRAQSRTRLSAEQLDELQEHLRALVHEELARGLPPAHALESARLRLGDVRNIAVHYPNSLNLMKHVSRMLGVALSAAIVLLTLGQTHMLSTFFEPELLAIVLGLVAGGLLAANGMASLSKAAKCTLSGEAPANREHSEELLALARRGYRLSWISGFLAMFMSALVALSAMESPASLAGALAQSSFGVLYGALLAELVFANLVCWVAAPRQVPVE